MNHHAAALIQTYQALNRNQVPGSERHKLYAHTARVLDALGTCTDLLVEQTGRFRTRATEDAFEMLRDLDRIPAAEKPKTGHDPLLDAIATLLPHAHLRLKELSDDADERRGGACVQHPEGDGLPEGWGMTDAYVEAKKALIAAGYTRSEVPNAIATWTPPTCQACEEFTRECTCGKPEEAAPPPPRPTQKDPEMITKPDHHGDRCECNLCCWAKKHPQCQPKDDKGIENRGTQRVLDDLGVTIEQASPQPATHEGMPAGDFAGLDPRGKTPRRRDDSTDYGGVLGADGQIHSDADPGL